MPFLKKPVVILLIAAAVLVAALVALGGGSLHQGVHWFGVPLMRPVFADLRLVLAGVDCTVTGHDVLVDNPCDPWKRPFNYPRLWLYVFGLFGWGQRAAIPIGFAFIAVFAAATLYILRGLPTARMWPAILAALSPAVLFLLERGNTDIVVFCILTLAVALRGRLGATGAMAAAPGLIFLAAAAKLYPAVAFAALLRGWQRRNAIAAAIGVLATALLFWLMADDIAKMARSIVTSPNLSFGRDIAVHFANGQLLLDLGGQQEAVSVALVGIAAGIAAFIAGRMVRGGGGGAADASAEAQDFFLVGALVFCGAFLAGRNWDYRLCFLIMCLPQTIAWAQAAATKRFGTWFTWTMVAALWTGELVPTIWTWSARVLVFPTVDEAANWILFTLCLSGIGVLLWPRRAANA